VTALTEREGEADWVEAGQKRQVNAPVSVEILGDVARRLVSGENVLQGHVSRRRDETGLVAGIELLPHVEGVARDSDRPVARADSRRDAERDRSATAAACR